MDSYILAAVSDTTDASPMIDPKILKTPEGASQEKVRVRFAPSPTGFMHIGSLRTALYNWLFAKHFGGTFILRIEDTDRARLTEGALENIMETLIWAGLDYGEGPMPKPGSKEIMTVGEHGPYVQSARLEIYEKHAENLIDAGKAYYCFCSKERLEKLRQEQTAKKLAPRYDGFCRNLPKEEIAEKLSRNLPHVVRQKIPQTGETAFTDMIRGGVNFKNSTLDDHILIKSDGWPTYHLASVVDDHLMEISHVIRGEEWLSSAPRHALLYEAFGWPRPSFAHLPILLNPDKTKLSKRKGDVAVRDYIAKGYLREAILNFILLLGWHPAGDKEIFTLKEMVDEFSFDRVNKSGAVFDLAKLDWMNGHYIKNTGAAKLTEEAIPFLRQAGLIEGENENYKIAATGEAADREWLEKIVTLEQNRIKKLAELPELVKFFFATDPDYEKGLLRWKKMTDEKLLESLKSTKQKIEAIPEDKFDKDSLKEALDEITREIGVGETLWPLRVAMTGLKASAGPFEVAEILGRKKVLHRIGRAIEKLNA